MPAITVFNYRSYPDQNPLLYETSSSVPNHGHPPLQEANHHVTNTDLTRKYVPCRRSLGIDLRYLQNQYLDEAMQEHTHCPYSRALSSFPRKRTSIIPKSVIYAIQKQQDNALNLDGPIFWTTGMLQSQKALGSPDQSRKWLGGGREARIVHSTQDLKAGNTTSVITIKGLTTVVKGENSSFFTVIAFADIETIDHCFRNVWLPTILDFGKPGQNLTPHDLNHPSGRFYHGFKSLMDAIKTLDYNLNRLHQVFKTYVDSLEVDKLTAGFFAIIHGYGLLFHMRAVYAKLHRIQIGAPTLTHPDLRYDTRLILKYLRLPLIGAVESRLVPLPQGNSFLVYYYRDNYNALSSTEEGRQLTVAQPPKFGESRSESAVINARARRVAGVEGVVQRMVYNVYKPTWQMYSDLNIAMRARRRDQGMTDGPGGFPGGRRPLPKLPPLRPPASRLKMVIGVEVPVCEGNTKEAGDDLDGFVANIPEAFFDLLQTDDDSDPFTIVPPTIKDSSESFKEDQDFDEALSTEDFLL
ncbi:hypothetical protein ARMGADRAFT_1164119 [Armillaria gallica]|uniref:Uncharacterized protein n=1 Tax=Armillaria gallica TaxID=47427 RepID=A0A2H3DK19_ARMGA|nr:hypothetical protein ARMGADRAFT_1164119 [Armillaria gallica]